MKDDKLINDLFKKAQNGDREARNTLVEKNFGLVISVAKGYNRSKFNHEVIKQEGAIGLIKAINKFDPERGIKFSTYAWYIIKGEIQRYIRDRNENVHVKIKTTDMALYYKILDAKKTLEQEFGGIPTTREIAILINEDEKEVEGLINALENVTSLENTKYTPKSHKDGTITVADSIADPTNIEKEVTNKLAIHEALEKLPERQKKIITWRYYDNLTQHEICRLLNINQPMVCREEKKALKKMREVLR